MNFSLVVSDRAIQQIEKAASWFFEQSPGLEVKFIKEIERGMNFIQKNPLKCQFRYKNVRVNFMKKFDFGIHYIIENNTVFVLCVFHTSQNSDDWF
jgi:plasmid stabilization system protein ParE